MLVAAPLVGAQTAHAQYPPLPPSLTLSATTVTAGGTVDFTATGFAPQQLVTASLESNPIVLGRYRAYANGTVHATVTIPKRVRAGRHTFKVTARNPDLTLSARIKVLAAAGRPDHHGHGGHDGHDGHDGPGRSDDRPGLADTGGEKALAVGGIAAGLVAVGGGTMLAMRRRRNS